MLIDTHTHLNFKAFDKDYLEVVKRAQKTGVEKIVVVGVDLESSKRSVEMAKNIKGVYATVGFHPHHVSAWRGSLDTKLKIPDIKNQLKKLTESKKVVGIGECGLDYFVYKKTKYGKTEITPEIKIWQKKLFGAQIQLAKELPLPLVVHNREAEVDILDTMDHFCKNDGKYPKGVFHCISGSKTYLDKVLSRGFWVGVTGNVTYDKKVQEIAREIPLDRLLIETDSPFLTPRLKRGLRNEPCNVTIVAEFLSQLKKVSVDKIKTSTTKNAEVLFFK